MKNENNYRRLRLGAVPLLLSLTVLLAGCGNNAAVNAGTTTQASAESSEKPVVTTVAETEEVTEDYGIPTDIITLRYPNKWKKLIRTNEEIEGDTGSVEFYGKLDKHDEALLFTIFFGTPGDIPIGTVQYKGKDMAVSCTLADLESVFDDSWSQEDKDTLCAMQEDVNYLTASLE